MKKTDFFSMRLLIIIASAVQWALKLVNACKFLPHRLLCKVFTNLILISTRSPQGRFLLAQIALTGMSGPACTH